MPATDPAHRRYALVLLPENPHQLCAHVVIQVVAEVLYDPEVAEAVQDPADQDQVHQVVLAQKEAGTRTVII